MEIKNYVRDEKARTAPAGSPSAGKKALSAILFFLWWRSSPFSLKILL